MAKTKQFRCPRCLKLLFKYNKLKEEMEYQVKGLQSQVAKETGDNLIRCPKCEVISRIVPEGLEQVFIKKTVVESEKTIEKAKVLEPSGKSE